MEYAAKNQFNKQYVTSQQNAYKIVLLLSDYIIDLYGQISMNTFILCLLVVSTVGKQSNLTRNV